MYSAGAVLRESLGSVDVTADELAQTAGDAREFTGPRRARGKETTIQWPANIV